jgi:hypothetical protein
MERWLDTAAVLLFAGATAFVALHARGWLGTDTHESPGVRQDELYSARVAAALPRLEGHVAAGSMRVRGLVCDERELLAEIADLEAAVGPGDDPAISIPLAEGIAALRACVACTPEPQGCGAAARAFTVVEGRLALPRGASGI